jgi:hypothetical protein
VSAQGRDGDPRTVRVGDAEEGLDAALAEFVTALDGGPTPSGEVRANIWSLAMVEAALASARTGETVRLDDVFAAASDHAAEAARAAGDHAVADAIARWHGAPPR